LRCRPSLLGGVAPEAAAAFLRASAAAIAEMVAGWLRVGFCQGNFNADNCLVGFGTLHHVILQLKHQLS
jgi:uncharacterized protein YdiU (UPF0061 family)